MTRSQCRAVILALCLAALAGYVDALGFLQLKGFFVSFMSGNSTRLSVGLAQDERLPALTAAGLIGLFVLGVIGGTLLAELLKPRRRPLLVLVAGLLGAGGVASSLGRPGAAIVLTVLALGAVNAVIQKAGEISIAVTYMTGTLVRMGQAIARALLGGPKLEWVPYLMLWAALVAGAVGGAAVFPRLGLQGLWVAAAWCAVLAVWVRDREGRL
ncbi:YoaK family protein [Lichenicola sp.]|uniref:YoaK family protein n=1 Tax=Lichenicola sp. TaxID=2804529 RepID=UPI003B008896